MNTEFPAISETEQKAIISICILAAFADGVQSEAERAQIKRVLDDFGNEHLDLSAAFQEVLSGRALLSDAAQLLQSQTSRALAYEMALCVCHADQPLTSTEKEFLAALRLKLNVPDSVGNVEESARGLASEPLALPPVIGQMAPDEQDIDSSIHNSAVLAGALEIMPQSLATMAIIPVQMRMVYKIGKRYGFELDRGHIKDFLATVGIGYGAQVIEGFVSKLAGGLARRMAGRLAGGLVSQAAESGLAFATTYALGQVAKRYYASGRSLSAAQLQEVFSSMLNSGRSLRTQYAPQIAQRSREVNVTELLPMIRRN